jgi:hypothetical protein
VSTQPPAAPRRSSAGLSAIRYGIPAAMVIGGITLLILSPSDNAPAGVALAFVGALALLMLNLLYRLGASRDAERAQEDAARRHFVATGEWPEQLLRSRIGRHRH